MLDDTGRDDLGCLDYKNCPVERTLRVVGGRWKPVLIFHIRARPRRFNELRRLVPTITQRVLTQSLRDLEADGILSRTVEDVVPPKVTYALTERGHSLQPVLNAMAAWGLNEMKRELVGTRGRPLKPSRRRARPPR